MPAIADAIFDREVSKPIPYFVARWLRSETVDPNLSVIQIPFAPATNTGDGEIRFVQKLKDITGLTAGDSVLCTTNPCIIIGIVVGDVTLASV